MTINGETPSPEFMAKVREWLAEIERTQRECEHGPTALSYEGDYYCPKCGVTRPEESYKKAVDNQ